MSLHKGEQLWERWIAHNSPSPKDALANAAKARVNGPYAQISLVDHFTAIMIGTLNRDKGCTIYK